MITNYDGQFLGITFALMGGIFAFVFGISGFRIMQYIGIGLGVLVVIGVVMIIYYTPLVKVEESNAMILENQKESMLKQMNCISIQKYLLDSLPITNSTTKYAQSVFDLKCKGVPIT